MSGPTMSIIVPAHNEEPIIGDFLRSLIADAEPGELELIVVCNGCTDETAATARAVGDEIRVLDIPVGDKPTALNTGDDVATVFPRLYVDADVDVELDALRACARALDDGALAAAPSLQVDTSRSTWPVRSYYRIWTRLPWVTESMVGSGIFGVSTEGRAHFDRFPAEGADDLWLSAQFAADERRSLPDHHFSVVASPDARQLVRRRSRIIAANRLVADQLSALPGAPRTGLRDVVTLVTNEPSLAPHAVPFVLISLLARLRSRRMLSRGTIAWEGDDRTAHTSN